MIRPTILSAALLILAACGGSSTPTTGPAALRDQPRALAPDDWPAWRGPAGLGVADDATPPVTWSATENVAWTVPIPGLGHASPVISGGRVYLATADAGAGTQSLVCLDAASGAPVWTRALHKGGLPRIHGDNSHASPTPACDGARVYVLLATDREVQLHAVAADGRVAWQKTVCDLALSHGLGGSPVLHRSTVIVAVESGQGGILAAYDRDTGELAWSVPRTATDSYGTPIVATLGGRAQLILHGGYTTMAYDPDTGQRLWQCEGPARTCANAPVAGGDRVYVSGGYPQKNLLCIRATGQGDLADEDIVWRDRRRVGYITSPLLHAGRLIAVTDGGRAICYDAATGEKRWQERIRDRFSASPVAAGGRIYAAAESGATYVLKAGDRYELLARNTLPGEIKATPAFSGARMYLRTDRAVYCLAETR